MYARATQCTFLWRLVKTRDTQDWPRHSRFGTPGNYDSIIWGLIINQLPNPNLCDQPGLPGWVYGREREYSVQAGGC